jgi:hypothetical protein
MLFLQNLTWLALLIGDLYSNIFALVSPQSPSDLNLLPDPLLLSPLFSPLEIKVFVTLGVLFIICLPNYNVNSIVLAASCLVLDARHRVGT